MAIWDDPSAEAEQEQVADEAYWQLVNQFLQSQDIEQGMPGAGRPQMGADTAPEWQPRQGPAEWEGDAFDVGGYVTPPEPGGPGSTFPAPAPPASEWEGDAFTGGYITPPEPGGPGSTFPAPPNVDQQRAYAALEAMNRLGPTR